MLKLESYNVLRAFWQYKRITEGTVEKRPPTALRCKPRRSTYENIRLAILFLRALYLSVFEQFQERLL